MGLSLSGHFKIGRPTTNDSFRAFFLIYFFCFYGEEGLLFPFVLSLPWDWRKLEAKYDWNGPEWGLER